MANNIRVAMQQTIITLWGLGRSARSIAAELGVNRKTVNRYVRLHKRKLAESQTGPGVAIGSARPAGPGVAAGLPQLEGDESSDVGAEKLAFPVDLNRPTVNSQPSLCETHREFIGSSALPVNDAITNERQAEPFRVQGSIRHKAARSSLFIPFEP